MVFELLWNPDVAVREAKSKKRYSSTFLALTIAALLLSINAVLFVPSTNVIELWIVVLAVFVSTFIVELYCGLLRTLVMKSLNGAGTYFAGLTSGVYPLMIFSVALTLLSAGFTVLRLFPQAKLSVLIVIAILEPLLLANVLSTHLRTLKELFETNMINSVVGCFIMGLLVAVAIYFVVIIYFLIMGIPIELKLPGTELLFAL